MLSERLVNKSLMLLRTNLLEEDGLQDFMRNRIKVCIDKIQDFGLKGCKEMTALNATNLENLSEKRQNSSEQLPKYAPLKVVFPLHHVRLYIKALLKSIEATELDDVTVESSKAILRKLDESVAKITNPDVSSVKTEPHPSGESPTSPNMPIKPEPSSPLKETPPKPARSPALNDNRTKSPEISSNEPCFQRRSSSPEIVECKSGSSSAEKSQMKLYKKLWVKEEPSEVGSAIQLESSSGASGSSARRRIFAMKSVSKPKKRTRAGQESDDSDYNPETPKSTTSSSSDPVRWKRRKTRSDDIEVGVEYQVTRSGRKVKKSAPVYVIDGSSDSGDEKQRNIASRIRKRKRQSGNSGHSSGPSPPQRAKSKPHSGASEVIVSSDSPPESPKSIELDEPCSSSSFIGVRKTGTLPVFKSTINAPGLYKSVAKPAVPFKSVGGPLPSAGRAPTPSANGYPMKNVSKLIQRVTISPE